MTVCISPSLPDRYLWAFALEMPPRAGKKNWQTSSFGPAGKPPRILRAFNLRLPRQRSFPIHRRAIASRWTGHQARITGSVAACFGVVLDGGEFMTFFPF